MPWASPTSSTPKITHTHAAVVHIGPTSHYRITSLKAMSLRTPTIVWIRVARYRSSQREDALAPYQ